MAFAHLHVHSEYSLLDGACRIGPLIDACKAMGMDSIAITDHGVMYGVIDFYKAAKAAGIHPVIGCEVYVAPGAMHDKTAKERDNGHLILLCENMQGYRNLTMLSSLGFTQGYYYRPRVDLATLALYSEGLIALSACLSGDVPKLLLQGRYDEAKAAAVAYRDIFGADNYFLEMQDHGMPEQRIVTQGLVRLSKELDIPLVATNDVHYIQREDAQAQEVLMCIQTGKTLADENRMSMSTQELYLKSPAEMQALFPYAPDAIGRTQQIAQRCNVEFELGAYHLPKFAAPDARDSFAYLQELCYAGARSLYGDPLAEDVAQRLGFELNMIKQMNYVDYFLIVWDFIRYAKEQDIMVGPGRGSAAGSIVAYALGITGIDPLKYGLIFERFLNPERVSMPDIDIDFCYERRQEVIDYVVKLYGEDQVAQIITFGTMAAKGAVRDVARVLGLPYAAGDTIAKLIPFALDMTLDKALTISAELRQLVEEDENAARLYKLARAVEGMPRHASTHAAGVVIAASPLTDYVPLQKNDDVVTTQFAMGTLEELGLLKMDFLGLRTLTVLRDALDLIKQNHGVTMTPEDIPLDDPAIYTMLGKGDTDGVFQLESGGMRRVLVELIPSEFEDIIAVISLYRPGPMESIPRYIKGKHQPESVHYEHPIMERTLSVTYGCMVYQEQVMQIVRDMAGYSMGRSDLVRRAMSKKKADVMEHEKEVFVHGLLREDGTVDVPGAVRNGVPEKVAYQVFEQMESFAQYAFNKSHAAAYALIACQTAWLKWHYPVEFMAASMNSVMGNTGKVTGFIQYCRTQGIAVLPPDVNHSGLRFSVEGGNIRFGLSAVRNVGVGVVNALLQARTEKPFEDIFDFCERVQADQLNKRALESLILAGAMDALPGNRAQKLALYERLLDSAASERKRNVQGQLSLFGAAGEAPLRPSLPKIPEQPMRLLLQREKEMTGIYISGHPLQEYSALLEQVGQSTAVFGEMADDENGIEKYDGHRMTIAGLVAECRLKTTRQNKQMCFITLEDLYGSVECLIFPRTYEANVALLQPDALLIVKGRLSLKEDDTPKLVVERIEPLKHGAPKAAAPAPATQLWLKVRDRQQAQAIRPLLRAGATPVNLRIEAEGRTVQAPSWACTLDDALLDALRGALGNDNVAVSARK